MFLLNSGGWTLISRFLMEDPSSPQDTTVESDCYREILPNYHTNSQLLLRDGFNQLKTDMGFSQIRFYCYKKKRDRVFHIVTNQNTKGANVVKFFTESDTIPATCGSFTRLPDDNSTLANRCNDWGYKITNKWGHENSLTKNRLYLRPILWARERYFTLSGDPLTCDDNLNGLDMSKGDKWQISLYDKAITFNVL